MKERKWIPKSDTWKNAGLIGLFLSAFFFLKVQFPFTNSGEITFYLAEIIGLMLGLFLIIYLLKNFKSLTKNNKWLFWTALASQVAFVAIFGLHIFTTGLELKSILVIESNLFVMAFYLLIAYKLVDFKRVITMLSYFMAGVGVFSVLSIFVLPVAYTDWAMFGNSLVTVMTFGNAIRTYILLVCLPLSAYNYIQNREKKTAISFYVHLFSTVVCGMISGARVNYLCVPMAIVLLAVLFFRFAKEKRWLRPLTTVSVSVLAVVFVFFISMFSMRAYTQMMRLEITNNVMEALNIEYVGLPSSSSDNNGSGEQPAEDKLEEMKSQILGSAAESASSRGEIWRLAIEDIKKAPLIGMGLQQYDFQFSNGVTLPLQPHNFILEYLLSYGFIGFGLWLIMMVTPAWIMWRKCRFKFWNSAELCLLLCSLAFACGGALFQPYFIYPCTMFFIFALMGCFYRGAGADED